MRPDSQATYQGANPPRVSGVGPRPLIGVRTNRVSDVCWGCLSSIHSPGAEGGGAPEASAAAKSSLISH